MPYAELHCITNFTFLRGASQPQEMVAQAAELGYSAIAITDECSFAGIVKAYVASKQAKIKLIVGSEFVLPDRTHLVALAPNLSAYSELSALISLARRRADKGSYEIQLEDFALYLPSCLIVWLPQSANEQDLLTGNQLVEHFARRLWLGVECFYQDQSHYLACYELAKTLDISMVACGNVHMHIPERKALQDTLTAIRLNTPITQLGAQRQINRERYLRPIAKLEQIYPLPLLEESVRISELCHFSMDELRYQYPSEVIPAGLTPDVYLRQLVQQGMEQHWPQGAPAPTLRQVQAELDLIIELHYEYYFLTIHDIVCFARSRDILCQGRGSAANSVVCFCLGITAVSPEKASLLFERFISKERNEPPDIDVDFEHERREEVIQYIYKKYSRERAALAATVICYRPRSAVRDVGKALGLDSLFIDQLSKSLAWWDRKNDLMRRFKEARMRQSEQDTIQIARHFMSLIQQILGFPRHLSQHVGGFIICKGPVSELVPVENASMPERTVIQWDKDDIDALGLLKVDVLALGMLSAIRKCFDLINQYSTDRLSLTSLPQDDEPTYKMLSRGDSLGVFQVESRAQMSMLPRLKPANYYDLVIQVAIVRPGPIQGGMVHPYLRRRNKEEPVTYEHEDLKGILSRTLGIPIFQEQVIKISMEAAGFSGGEADQLRRAMASWGKNGNLMQFKDRFINGMLGNGYSADFAERLFNQMKGFGSYGFPESHSASFAILVYFSAWMKCHHAAAFYCAIINSQPMGFYSPSQLIQDAKRHGIEVRPVDVDYSEWDCTLEDIPATKMPAQQPPLRQPAIRLGMRLIKGFNAEAAQRLAEARHAGRFVNLLDMNQRTSLNQQERTALVRANALARFSGHRHQAHWQNRTLEPARPLFAYESKIQPSAESPSLPPPSEAQNMLADYNSLGLTLNRHPMAVLRDSYPFNQCKTAATLRYLNHGRFVRIAGIVTGRQRPGTASGVIFVTLEDETGNMNVIVWKSLQERFRKALLTGKLLLIKGVVEINKPIEKHKQPDNESDSPVVHIIAGEIVDQSQAVEGMLLPSRDFH